jgi:hypothetical protein
MPIYECATKAVDVTDDRLVFRQNCKTQFCFAMCQQRTAPHLPDSNTFRHVKPPSNCTTSSSILSGCMTPEYSDELAFGDRCDYKLYSVTDMNINQSNKCWMLALIFFFTLLSMVSNAANAGQRRTLYLSLSFSIPESERTGALDLLNNLNIQPGSYVGVFYYRGDPDYWSTESKTECDWALIQCSTAGANWDGHIDQIVGIGQTSDGLTDGYVYFSGKLPSLQPFPYLKRIEIFGKFDPDLARYHVISGNLPSFAGLSRLEYIRLGYHQISGQISSLSGLPALKEIILNDNKISGSIPRLSESINLTKIGLENNRLDGTIQDLSGLTNLQYMDFQNNQLKGQIPDLSTLSSLRVANFQNNRLSGPLPPLPPQCGILSYLPTGCTINICGNNLSPSGIKAIDDAWDIAAYRWRECQASSDMGPIKIINPYKHVVEYEDTSSASDPSLLAVSNDEAESFSADGVSAVLVSIPSADKVSPVTLKVNNSNAAKLSTFTRNYLTSSSSAIAATAELTLGANDLQCIDDLELGERCFFLALLWPSDGLPASRNVSQTGANVQVSVTATQKNQSKSASISLAPPPVLMVHGIWSSAEASRIRPNDAGGLGNYLKNQLSPIPKVGFVDYGSVSDQAFHSFRIQSEFDNSLMLLLQQVNNQSNMAARKVDVVAHSMGGLVTRYYMNNRDQMMQSGKLPRRSVIYQNPVHQLITIGTPHLGSELATQLFNNKKNVLQVPPRLLARLILSLIESANVPGLIAVGAGITGCATTDFCTLGNVLSIAGKKVGDGVVSLIPSNTTSNLPNQDQYKAIVGNAPSSSFSGLLDASVTEKLLNILIGGFIPGKSVDSILGTDNDTIVANASQAYGANQSNLVSDVVHTTIIPGVDTGETENTAVFSQVFEWLTKGRTPTPTPTRTATRSETRSVQLGSPPSLSLEGFTEVSNSAVTFAKVNGSSIQMGQKINLTPAVAGKTLKELWVFQSVVDPADQWFYYSTTYPFAVAAVPNRLGVVAFSVFSVFTDKTFAVSLVNYSVVPPVAASALRVLNAPPGALPVGYEGRLPAMAMFEMTEVDVSRFSTYSVRSGTSSVLKVDESGVVTVVGSGEDWIDVTYGGLKASSHLSTSSTSVDSYTCLFAWAEAAVPLILGNTRSASINAGDFVYRRYAQTNSYFGFSKADGHTYFAGPASNLALLDLGPTSMWLTSAGCAPLQ